MIDKIIPIGYCVLYALTMLSIVADGDEFDVSSFSSLEGTRIVTIDYVQGFLKCLRRVDPLSCL